MLTYNALDYKAYTRHYQYMQRRTMNRIGTGLLGDRLAFAEDGIYVRSYRLARCVAGLARHFPSMFFKEIEIEKLLMGGEGGKQAAAHARLTSDLLRPSCPISKSPHAELLHAYRERGEDLFSPDQFEATSYYKSGAKCIERYGHYFAAQTPDTIIQRARKFCQMFEGTPFEKHENGENLPGSPVVVQRIKLSDCYEIIHGQHRLAAAAVKGLHHYECLIQPSEAVLTPLQQMILDSNWTKGRCELYQPISAPELGTWPVVRQCADRLGMMSKWLADHGVQKSTYLDICCSYGWFVAEMAKRGFQAYGIDRDMAAISVGRLSYGLDHSSNEVGDVITFLDKQQRQFEIVSCFSILHHAVLGNMRCSAAEFIRKVDAITGIALFLDTGECHEEWFSESLAGWNAEFTRTWLKENTSFTNIEILGTDADNVGPYRNQYQRHLFVCSR